MKWRLRLFAFLTIASTAIISFASVKSLAEFAGFGQLAWLYPICLDAVAALGMDIWLSRSGAARSGARLATAAVMLSLTANVADWWIKQGTVLAALMGAVPPAMLAALLATLHRHVVAEAGAPPDVPTEPGPGLGRGPLVPTTLGSGAPRRARPVPPRRDYIPEPLAQPVEPVGGPERTNGAVHQAPAPVRSARRAKPDPVVQPDEVALVQALVQADPRGEWSRRRVEEFLTGEAGLVVGSSKATRLMTAARNGAGA